DGSEPAPIASGPDASQEPPESANEGEPAEPEPEPEPATSATETDSGPAFAANTRPDTAEPSGAGDTFLTVTDVRVAAHDGYDRVVFDLDGTGSGKPGWRVEYVDQAVDDGSGDTVRVDGDAILRVSISGTATPTDSGVDEFSGDRIEPADTRSIDEIVYRYWFEGYTTAFLGVDGAERPFRAFLLEDPMRVVVDVQH
ncbi:AMIN-like domain-containing (lipo)protein, partial [Promicromonospora kroppenstedtii]|uniref:AMIN-like domain-containing (lipo)protein n=1 Tax=Promicromonospora kroppenstedtii TaxID=440482 RepID=UPI0006876C56